MTAATSRIIHLITQGSPSLPGSDCEDWWLPKDQVISVWVQGDDVSVTTAETTRRVQGTAAQVLDALGWQTNDTPVDIAGLPITTVPPVKCP